MRLSFRLDEDEEGIWLRLKADNPKRTDKFLFHEMLMREDYRMKGNSKDDRLQRIEEAVLRGNVDHQEILAILRRTDAPNTDHA